LSGSKLPVGSATQSRRQQASETELQAQAEQQFERLVQEVRVLEGYYQEATSRVQSASDALTETRSAIEAVDGLAKSPKSEVLLSIGAGILLPLKEVEAKKYLISVGAGVAIEKDVLSVRAFLETRQKEIQQAVSMLEQQRREIGTRLEAGKSALQQITGQS
jgi:prefoldin alpha subunit